MNEEITKGAIIAKEALEDKKAEDIKVLDLKGMSNIADCFVIASGNNINQIRAMADEVEEKMFKAGYTLHHSEGYQAGVWILLDYGDIIVHLFNKENRKFYNLEKVWGDAEDISKKKAEN